MNVTVTPAQLTVIVRPEQRTVVVRRNVVLGDGGAVTSVAGRTGAVVLTKADVGLASVDNTADAAKPVSTLQAAADAAVLASAIARANHTGAQAISTVTGLQAALDAKAASSHSHAISDTAGLQATLDAKADLSGGKLLASQLPDVAVSEFLGEVASQAAMLALTGQRGDWCIRTDTGTNFVLVGDDATQLANWRQLSYPAAPVSSVAGKTGVVTLDKADVGLGNVDNVSDANKPVSTATQTALDGKEATQTAASQVEAEAGSETAIRSWSPLRIWQAIAAKLTLGTWVSAADGKATPVDADSLPLSDSAAGNVLKKLTWANLKATLKTYFDTLYPSGSGTSSGTNTGDQTSVSGNAGTATALATARSIYGNNFDGTAALAQIIASTFGGTGNGFTKFTGPATSEKTFTLPNADASLGYLGIPQNSQSANYTTVAADAGKHLYHPAADTTARTWTIDSNANVAYPIGTAITFDNDYGAGALTIAITSDTLVLVGTAGSTGSRTLASGGQATAIKVASTRWRISGTGLT